MAVPYPKGGGGGWTCVEDNVVWEKEEHNSIVLFGFVFKLFKEEEGVGVPRGHIWVYLFEAYNFVVTMVLV